MDFGLQTLSVFFTVFLILTAIGVALVVDLMKGNIEQLRETAIDLKARKDAAEEQVKQLEASRAVAPAPAPAIRASQQETRALDKPQSVVSIRESRPRREMSPAVAAVAESVAARLAANGGRGIDLPKPAAEQHRQSAPEIFAPQPAVSVAVASTSAAADSRKNWNQLLNRRKGGGSTTPEVQQTAANVIEFDSLRGAETLPAGYYEYATLQKASESSRPFTGMVVSIGLNQLDRAQLGIVSNFVRSLMDPGDFACQSGAEEFLLVANGIEGEAAQRRLAGIAEKLWDFQLRSLGTMNLQFSWGGSECRGERLNDAVASAIDQMQDTRRGRRNAAVAQAV